MKGRTVIRNPERVEPPHTADVRPVDETRGFADLPIAWQTAILEKERARTRRFAKLTDGRRRTARRTAIAGAVAFLIASLLSGIDGVGANAVALGAGAGVGWMLARGAVSGPAAAVAFGGSFIVLQFAVSACGLATPLWSGAFFLWVLMCVAGKFLGDHIETANEGL